MPKWKKPKVKEITDEVDISDLFFETYDGNIIPFDEMYEDDAKNFDDMYATGGIVKTKKKKKKKKMKKPRGVGVALRGFGKCT
tara:strand:+ start:46 stop:294 length:249 start_codon:yes stop_codon:yes gene_type:complete